MVGQIGKGLFRSNPKTAIPPRTIRLNRWNAKVFGTNKRDVVFSGPPVRTLADMSKDEIKKLEQQYGMKVK